MSNPDRHARVERQCESCGNVFMARIERVNKGQGRFCSLKCANDQQRLDKIDSAWGYEKGKCYWDGVRYQVHWYDKDGTHVTSYAKWWWTLNVGEVPDGFVVRLKDKNPRNIDPSNFELFPKGKIWAENGKGNKGRTGLKWTSEQKMQMSNQRRKNWKGGVYDSIHMGEHHHGWKGGKSKEEYPKEFYEIREFVLDRDRYQCQICGRSFVVVKYLHVHHRNANKNDNDMDNLLTLCVYCHNQVHSDKPTSEPIMALRSELYQ